MDATAQLTFAYDSLDAETRIVVRQRTSEIRTLMRNTAQDIIDIGVRLSEVKAMLGHGHFGDWLRAEFGWTDRTARHFMMVSDRFKSEIISDLDIASTALVLLAAPSTPDSAVEDAIQRAQAGQPITVGVAKTIIADHRPQQREHHTFMPPPPATVVYTNGHAAVTPAADGEAEEVPVELPRPHVAHNSGNNEWYTPREYTEAARRVMGEIDLDPASSEEANAVVGATQIFTIDDDGLTQNWFGRVWLNPPYAQPFIAQFCDKLAAEFDAGNVTEATVLVNNATETGWFRTLVARAAAVVFPSGRVRFWSVGGSVGAPLQGQAIIYMGDNAKGFLAEYRRFGWGVSL